MQSKRRDLQLKRLHRETNDNTLIVIVATTMNNNNLFLDIKGACHLNVHCMLSVSANTKKNVLFQWNRQNKGPALLTITLLVHRSYYNLIMFGSRWLGWKWIATWKKGTVFFFQFFPVFYWSH